MSTRIVLVRHATCAQTDSVLLGRALDAPLDARGELQVQGLAQHFAGAGLARVETSPRLRARQTAGAIAASARCEVAAVDALDEVDFGEWAGRTFAELAQDARWRRWNERRATARTPAGAAMRDVQRRIVSHLLALRSSHPHAAVALVTHAELIRAALMYCLDAPLDAYWRYVIDPASLTTLEVSAQGAWSVRGVNQAISAWEAAS